jgi:hypothetical protein
MFVALGGISPPSCIHETVFIDGAGSTAGDLRHCNLSAALGVYFVWAPPHRADWLLI